MYLNDAPRHVAIIMDGNGRWAKKRGLPRIAGHRAGVDAIKRILPVCEELGVKTLTLYAFSKENWTRPQTEIKGLMSLLVEFIDRELRNLNERNARISVIGSWTELALPIRDKLSEAIEKTSSNSGVHINLAINYGGRQEILNAINRIVLDFQAGKIAVEDIDGVRFGQYLDTHDLDDPDLLIRTSGEKRVSNFLLWQLSYSEIYATDTLWPDFDEACFRLAIEDYMKRERRYGNVGRLDEAIS